MSGNDSYDRVYEAQLKKLNEIEAEKRMLHDRTIGGDFALRPSPEFIEKHTGPLQSDKQLEQEASRRAHEIMNERQKAILERNAEPPTRSKLDELTERTQLKGDDLENRPSLTDRFHDRSRKIDGHGF